MEQKLGRALFRQGTGEGHQRGAGGGRLYQSSSEHLNAVDQAGEEQRGNERHGRGNCGEMHNGSHLFPCGRTGIEGWNGPSG